MGFIYFSAPHIFKMPVFDTAAPCLNPAETWAKMRSSFFSSPKTCYQLKLFSVIFSGFKYLLFTLSWLWLPSWLREFEPYPWICPLLVKSRLKSQPHDTVRISFEPDWGNGINTFDDLPRSKEHSCFSVFSPAPQIFPFEQIIEWLPPPFISLAWMDFERFSCRGTSLGTDSNSDSNP